MASVEALDYSPNISARSLANNHPHTLGFLFARSTGLYIDHLLAGTLTQARKMGCQVTVRNTLEPGSERKAIAELVQNGVSGILLPAPLCDSDEALAALATYRIPSVLIGSGHPAPGFSAVSIDDRAAAQEMTRHLISLGHCRIAFITGHPEQTASSQRFLGYLQAMANAGIEVSSKFVAQGFFTYRSGLEASEHLLKSVKPSAIFAANDEMAAASVAVAHRIGLEVPRDVSIVGFDDTPLATMITPHLTTIRRPLAAMAAHSVELLVGDIGRDRVDASKKARRELVKFELVERGSCAPIAKM